MSIFKKVIKRYKRNGDEYLIAFKQELEWVPVRWTEPETDTDRGKDTKVGEYVVSLKDGSIEKFELEFGIKVLEEILDDYVLEKVYIEEGGEAHEASDSELLDIGRRHSVWLYRNYYHVYENEYYDIYIHLDKDFCWLKGDYIGPSLDNNEEYEVEVIED